MADNGPQQGLAEVRITPSDVGRRVSVRRILEIVERRPVFGDAVGVLTSWDGGVLTVVRRDGEAVEIAEDLLVAGKPVPPAPARRGPAPEAGPAELQRIAARGWPAMETAALGEWTLRAADGFTRRANSVQALGDPGLPLPAALDAVRDWYGARGLPALVEVTVPGSDAVLREELDRFAIELSRTEVRSAPLAPLARLADAGGPVRLAHTASADWMARYHRFGGDPALEQAARAVLHGGPSVWFATVPSADGSGPAAIGRCVVDGAWAGFSAVEVVPEQRRRGLGSQVMAALAARAAEEGATGAYLQVETANSGATALYDRLGFATSHTYHYCRLPRS
ncbi:GNAT family N-acetyltransferase [Peterkaempfera bronchialis]|uniref:GNAT family N-acetyltransferase n=2 Tax=Peterkaempfera bronchialis TaxID=2126346 RepID=A0A345SZY7_9ACTN|nr:GNAT family N-acetyltransferase [Peterkaempfera bronchialis]AXI79292.1 GNAT family N-acetyltransferase [Peterkaempfera bronchialis]